MYIIHNGRILSYSTGEKISPINNKPKHEADIKPTIQIRLGAEYSVIGKRTIVPIRAGIFYDPEPAAGSVDDFYGLSLGTGIVFKKYAFDIAYQYRFGHKKRGEYMLSREISTDERQHYLYTSMIFYF